MQSQREGARRLLDRWRDNSVAFVRDVTKTSPWSRQIEAQRIVETHAFSAIRSGHKCGKSRMLAGLALWWASTRPQGRVVFTATAGHQVENILWPELRKLYELAARAGRPIGGRLYDDYHKGLKLSHGREIIGLTTRDSEAFAGLSSPNLLFLVDEASGFPEPIFNAVIGNLAGGGRVVLTGNPTRTSGTFFDAFHSKRDVWGTLKISSLDSPNFHGDDIPGLATPAWAELVKRQWGEGTPAWDVRVLGNFTRGDSDTVIALGLIEDAKAREVEALGRLEVGVDCARFGSDETVVVARRGYAIALATALPPGDGPNTAGRVVEALRDAGLMNDAERPRIKVDEIGIGASVLDALARRDDVETIGVNVARTAVDSEHYHLLRDELWFGVRSWLADGGALPELERLEADLLAPKYSFDGRGRYLVESKDSMKKRLGRSPDWADALALAVFSPPLVVEDTEPAILIRHSR